MNYRAKICIALCLSRFNLLFLLSGGGKFNYQGTRRWIEDQLESAGISGHLIFPYSMTLTSVLCLLICDMILLAEPSLLSDIQHVICFDALGAGNGLYLHVSKPPKEGSPGDSFTKVGDFVRIDLEKYCRITIPQTSIPLIAQIP